MRYDRVKRTADIVTAACGLLLCLPLLAAVAVVVACAVGRPVLFRQVRPGKAGRPFTLVKFRTMRDVDERRGLLSDEQRLTATGRVLRALSLDELPTLWNVVRGDMSLVGPRPLLMGYLRRYTVEQSRRHEVRPGITGLAQISGRNALSWPDKLALDTWYVDHRSLALDLWILLRTVPVVLTGTGVRAPGHATAPEFAGPSAGRAEERA
ncbi:sugar transferase [Phytohabitans suffuscus]|uniref:Sugar transferase n=1 Tax=Phytohabitans suffuscus TaxID=624315 RepID=A0A6F8YCZ7_9ACTN|nr:sugar transferase [Phytohabitans suffuscus]BCB83831.1 sugar transferase [Phytohabitans suffuscus]